MKSSRRQFLKNTTLAGIALGTINNNSVLKADEINKIDSPIEAKIKKKVKVDVRI